MKKDTNRNSQQPEAQQPGGFEKIVADFIQKSSREPSPERGPGAWEVFASGTRRGLADLVERILGPMPESTREPDPGRDR